MKRMKIIDWVDTISTSHTSADTNKCPVWYTGGDALIGDSGELLFLFPRQNSFLVDGED